MNKIELSIICPVYNEESYIEVCINSLLKAELELSKTEILFIDGMSTDKTRKIIKQYEQKFKFIKLLDNPQRIAPCGLNLGIMAAKGNIIIRIDAHAKYQPDYFSVLKKWLIRLKADNVGCLCKTEVLHKNPKSLAIAEVLCSKFGVGNSYFRLGVNDIKEVDTVPFGCWHKTCFEKYGLFDTRLTRSEDIEFNKRITRGNGKIFLLPFTYCTYYARETFKALAAQSFQNGKGTLLTPYLTGRLNTIALRHLIPLLFVASLILPTAASFVFLPFAVISSLSLLSYTLLTYYFASKLAITKQLNFAYLVFSFWVLHFSYGIGSIAGLFTILFDIKKSNSGVEVKSQGKICG